jgi:hypothetical protein
LVETAPGMVPLEDLLGGAIGSTMASLEIGKKLAKIWAAPRLQ